MSVLKRIGGVIGVILGVVLVMLMFIGNERDKYFDLLSDAESQNEGVIGLFLIREDLVPFLCDELENGDHEEMTEIGIVKLLSKKYASNQEKLVEETCRRIIPKKSDEVKKRLYQMVAVSHNKEVLDIVMNGLRTETNEDIIVILLENLPGYGKQIEEDPELKAELGAILLRLKGSANSVLDTHVVRLLGYEVKRLVDRAEKEAENFNFTGAEKFYQEALELVPDNLLLAYSRGKFLYRKKAELEAGEKVLREGGYFCSAVRVDTPPEIDGKGDDPTWEKVPRLTGFYKSSEGGLTPQPATVDIVVKFAYDKDYLYVFTGGYGRYDRLVAKSKGRDSAVYSDDCVELYFDHDLDESTYWQILCNVEGTIADGLAEAQRSRRRNHPRQRWNGFFKSDTYLEKGKGWSAEFAFPWKTFDLERAPEKGEVWGMNVAWVKQAKPAQYAQWTMTYGSSHQPWYFGYMKFE